MTIKPSMILPQALRGLVYALCLVLFLPVAGQAADKLYELRIYTANPGKLDDLNARFRDHTLDLFAKHGIENLYYWTVLEGAESDENPDNMLLYVVAHKDKATADAAWSAFLSDPEWQRVARESEKDGRLLAGPPVSIYMEATDFSPPDEPVNRDSGAPARLFELRKYNTGEEGLPGTIDRFQAFEAELFRTHGMETVSFWTALDKSSFIYLLAHEDRESARASWESFFADFREHFSKYNASRETPPAGDGPPQRMTSEIRYLVPTDYSPRK